MTTTTPPDAASLASGAAAAPSPQAAAAGTAAADPRLRGLQRTPLPLVLARMKVLLERVHSAPAAPEAASAPAAASGWARPRSASGAGSALASPLAAAAAPCSSGCGGSLASPDSAPRTPTGARGTPHQQPQPPRRPRPRGMSEPSISIGGGAAVDSVATYSRAAALDELQLMLGFVAEQLAALPAETRASLAAVARLESYKKDQLIYDAGDAPCAHYTVLSGRVDLWSHPPGAMRPKSVLTVLQRGAGFGDQAIISGEPHSTAASPGCNATLLVVARQDFLDVLGPHFRGVTSAWQRFLGSIVPLAGVPPAQLARLCATLVSSAPAAGREYDLQQHDHVYFVKAGTFELRLIDLEAQRAADAALAAAVASASSTLAIAPLPACLRAAGRRPGTTPTGGARNTGAARARGAAPPPARAEAPAAAPARGADAMAAGGLGSGAADGLPALGAAGVLASVRVCGGRLMGTQGLEAELRKHHRARVPFKVLATLGPGAWFGGGPGVIGCGASQDALRVVAVGRGCELVHTHLSGLVQHGGEAILRNLRDDAAFKLTFYLGRVGLLPPGVAVGHPEAGLLASATAARPSGGSRPSSAAARPGSASTAARPGSAGAAARRASCASSSGSSSCHDGTGPLPATVQQQQQDAEACSDVLAMQHGGPDTLAARGAPADGDDASDLQAGLRRPGRARQKRVHVAGSGVYSPATMAALQHVRSLQAPAAAELTAGQRCCQDGLGAPASRGGGGGLPGSSRPSTAPGGSGCGGSDGRLQTAADAFWSHPDHSSTPTGVALSGLLSQLFTDGLQPLVSEVDRLLARAAAKGRIGALPLPLQPRPASAAPRLQRTPPDVLQHCPAASLVAASVLWQRSGAAGGTPPPLRQCLTTAEIAGQPGPAGRGN